MPDITNPTEPFFKDGQWGWDGTQWRKLNLLWGYNDVYGDYVEEAGTGADPVTFYGAAVGLGEVWKVCGASVYHISGTCDLFIIGAYVGGTLIYMATVDDPVAYKPYPITFEVFLKYQDKMFVTYENLASAEVALMWFWGYKMKVTE